MSEEQTQESQETKTAPQKDAAKKKAPVKAKPRKIQLLRIIARGNRKSASFIDAKGQVQVKSFPGDVSDKDIIKDLQASKRGRKPKAT